MKHTSKATLLITTRKLKNKQIVVKQAPTHINQENHYTFVKQNNQQLLDMIADLQQQINNLQQQINNLQ